MNDKKSSEEMISINSSLLVLGKCISSLALKTIQSSNNLSHSDHSYSDNNSNISKKKKIYIPYRDSLLTMIL